MGKYVRSFWHFVRALTDISGKATKQIESKYNLSNVEVGTRLMFPQYESVITARIGNVCFERSVHCHSTHFWTNGSLPSENIYFYNFRFCLEHKMSKPMQQFFPKFKVVIWQNLYKAIIKTCWSSNLRKIDNIKNWYRKNPESFTNIFHQSHIL